MSQPERDDPRFSADAALFEQGDARRAQPEPLDVLKRIYGYSSFRGKQAQVVEHVVGGGDAVVLFPTGAGKSLCFQIPALCRDGLGIIVSPLIALMRDQVQALKQLDVRAAALNSSLTRGSAGGLSRRQERFARSALCDARAHFDG
jgi:ATP-dependent DNA helicase RecQ